MPEKTDQRCGKSDCHVAVNGACAEGHEPLVSCPNYGSALADEIESDDEDLEALAQEAAPGRVELSSGEVLTSADVEVFLRWRPATFVTIIGERESGKTTLVCALYDRFLRGPFSGLSFAGSRTLIALERRSHYSRVDSGRFVPDTTRTSISEGLSYFHFAVAPVGKPKGRVDLFLSDRAGEIYRRARGNSDLIGTLPEIPQAHRIVLLLDGGRVAEPAERHGAMHSVRQTLRAFLDNDALGSSSIVQVVTTKIDIVAAHKERDDISRVVSAFAERLTADFAPRLRQLTFHDISARDPSGQFAPAHGTSALISDWVISRPRAVPAKMPPLELRSEFDRLLDRTPIKVIP
jgi:hypothetical protein